VLYLTEIVCAVFNRVLNKHFGNSMAMGTYGVWGRKCKKISDDWIIQDTSFCRMGMTNPRRLAD